MLDTEAQELTLQQSLLNQEVLKLNPFEVYYVLHFISLSKFLFCCFCLNCPDSKCFNLLCFIKQRLC
jgi:hypothetical protein